MMQRVEDQAMIIDKSHGYRKRILSITMAIIER